MRAHLQGLLLLLPIVAVSCSVDHTELTIDVPDEIRFLALLSLDDEGRVAGGSALRPHAPGRMIELAAPADAPSLLVGYSAEQLSRYPTTELTTESADNRLRAAVGCESRLPEPEWAARWSESGSLESEAPPTFPLTADSVQVVCPEPESFRVSVDRRCSTERCVFGTTTLDRCTLGLDLSGCGVGAARLHFDAFGESCLDLTDPVESCSVSPGNAPAVAQLSCEDSVSCEFDLYAAARSIDDGLQTESVRAYEGEPYQHSTLARNVLPLPRALLLYSGYTFDMLPLADRLVTLSVSDAYAIQDCTRLKPVLLSSYDLETLAPVETATIPPCAYRALPDPIGAGFIASFYEGARWNLGRFDARGRLLNSAPAGGEGELASLRYFGSDFDVTEIGRTDAGEAIILLFSRKLENAPEPFRAALGVYAVTSFELLHLHELGDGEEPRSMAVAGTEAILPSAITRRVRWIDVFSGELRREVTIEQANLALASFTGVMFDVQTDQTFLALTGAERGVAQISGSETVRRFVMYESDFETISFGPWPWDPELRIASGIVQDQEGSWNTSLALFEPRASRFLPGSVSLGRGIVSRIRTDTEGRLYFLLPWRPEVVRWSRPSVP